MPVQDDPKTGAQKDCILSWCSREVAFNEYVAILTSLSLIFVDILMTFASLLLKERHFYTPKSPLHSAKSKSMESPV